VRNFEGKVAVVTGGGRGIGLALAETMAQRGMRVVVSDLEPAHPDRVATRLRTAGRADVEGVVCDVRDTAQVDRLAHTTVERFGRVDVICNNAGVVAGGRAWEIPADAWRRVLDVNLWGVINGVRSFVPLLLANPDGGHVVNVASMASVITVPGIAPYNVSKHGVLALSETLRADLRAAGSSVGVTVVMPGRVSTGIGLPSGAEPPAFDESEPGLLTAETVAERVMAAVEADQLYLFTHPDSLDSVGARFAAILGR
jgi:NAD(P)-dependent dehydrogenase (short-subunit alcohol dehydrogenase family)